MPMRRKSQICIIPHIWKMSDKGRGVSEFASPISSFGTFVWGEFDFWLSFELVDIRVSAFAILFKFSKFKLYLY
jgi:hypothetical protein